MSAHSERGAREEPLAGRGRQARPETREAPRPRRPADPLSARPPGARLPPEAACTAARRAASPGRPGRAVHSPATRPSRAGGGGGGAGGGGSERGECAADRALASATRRTAQVPAPGPEAPPTAATPGRSEQRSARAGGTPAGAGPGGPPEAAGAWRAAARGRPQPRRPMPAGGAALGEGREAAGVDGTDAGLGGASGGAVRCRQEPLWAPLGGRPGGEAWGQCESPVWRASPGSGGGR